MHFLHLRMLKFHEIFRGFFQPKHISLISALIAGVILHNAIHEEVYCTLYCHEQELTTFSN